MDDELVALREEWLEERGFEEKDVGRGRRGEYVNVKSDGRTRKEYLPDLLQGGEESVEEEYE